MDHWYAWGIVLGDVLFVLPLIIGTLFAFASVVFLVSDDIKHWKERA